MRWMVPFEIGYALFALCLTPDPPKPKAPGSVTITYQEIAPTQGAHRATIRTTPAVTDPEANVLWLYPLDDPDVTVVSETDNELVLEAPLSPERSFSVVWSCKEKGKAKVVKRTLVKLGHGPKPPPDPDPPGPGPSPDPNNPSPFDKEGLRVMFLFRDGDYDKYTLDQKKMVRGQEIRDYFARVLADGSNGFRIYQVGVDVSGEEEVFKKAAAKSVTVPADAPYLMAGNGKSGFSGPAPKSVDDLKAILKKLGAKE